MKEEEEKKETVEIPEDLKGRVIVDITMKQVENWPIDSDESMWAAEDFVEEYCQEEDPDDNPDFAVYWSSGINRKDIEMMPTLKGLLSFIPPVA